MYGYYILTEEVIKPMGHISVDNIWKDSLTYMYCFIHHTENGPLISLGWFDLFNIIF